MGKLIQFIKGQKGINKKISYRRRAYESVDEKKTILGYVPKNDEKIIWSLES